MRALLFSIACGLASCQPILGIEDRELDPIREGVCELPRSGDARVRFANLVPNRANVDVCLTPAGAKAARGLLRGGGTTCPAGFRYTDVSSVFTMAAGEYDAKIVNYGERCDGRALAEARVVLAPNKTTTLVHHASTGSPSLRAYVDNATLQSGKTIVRLVNAIANGPALDFGIAASGRPPTKLLQKLFATAVRPGESSAGLLAATFSVTPDGYAVVPTTAMNLGAAAEGRVDAELAIGVAAADSVRTLYAIGDPREPPLPVRGLICDDLARDTTPLSSCTLSALSTLSVDLISAGLFGGVAKLEAERRDPLFERIAQRDADLVCVTQIGRTADKAALIARAKARFPYAVDVSTNLDTQPTVPENAAGVVPPLPSTPACGGDADPAKAKALLDCLSTKCTTTGTDAGKLRLSGDWKKPNADCLSEQCASPYLALLTGDTPGQQHAHARCFNCSIATFLSDKTMGEVRSFCTTDARDGYSFDGETPSLILSRLPIREQASFILPSTTFRRAVHLARVEIEPGNEVDFYCGHTNTNFGSLVPYGGRYSDKHDEAAWIEERALEVTRILDWIKRKSGSRPVILAGEWDSSNAIGTTIESREPDIVDALEKVFVHALPAGHVPECTMCPDNPIGNSTQRALTTRIYTLNFPTAAATEMSTFFKEPVVPIDGVGLVQLSGLYGLNARLRRP